MPKPPKLRTACAIVLQSCAVCVCVLATSGCEPAPITPPQVIVRVSSTDEVRQEMDALRITTAVQQSGSAWSVISGRELKKQGLMWPVDIPVVPEGGVPKHKRFDIVVEAMQAKKPIVQARAVIEWFTEGVRVLELQLTTCGDLELGDLCETDPSCHGTSCLACFGGASCLPVGLTEVGMLLPFDSRKRPQEHIVVPGAADAAIEAGTEAGVDAALDAGGDASAEAGADAMVDAGGDASIDTGVQMTLVTCADNHGDCDALVSCTDVSGVAVCGACPGGYSDSVGDGHKCTDILECATNNGGCDMSPMATCNEVAGGANTCTCPGGTSTIDGGATCTDILTCATGNGGCDTSPMATCNEVAGGPNTCTCPGGYTTIDGGATCTDILTCAVSNGGCDTNPMATCNEVAGGPNTCTCPGGYTTSDGGVTCTDVLTCAIGNGGCDTSPMATCNEVVGGPNTCTCPGGYTTSDGGVTCTDILTCATGNGGCDTNPMATCNEVVGGPNTCTCPGGYTTSDGGVICTDIDECLTNNGGCGSLSCINNAGAAPTCANIDECAGANVCTVDYPCQNLDPYYTCRGQFSDWPPAYSASAFIVNGNGTVTDSLSGLVWQQAVDAGSYDWAGAKTYCTGLSLAGGGWRLPTKAELESIIDFTYYAPSIDPTAFPGTPALPYWSSSPYAGNGTSGHVINFYFGSSLLYPISDGSSRVRCVRSSAAVVVASGTGGAPPGRYTFPASGTVHDTRTKLTWQQAVPAAPVAAGCSGTKCTQPGAAAYCTGLSLAGSGWRLPNVRELQTLVDPTRYEPSIDPTAFPSTPSDWFWSSSPDAGGTGDWWTVVFAYSSAMTFAPSNPMRVRCVRSCPSGYTTSDGGATCTDILTCAVGNGGCDTNPLATCNEVAGGPNTCTCPGGYTTSDGGATCTDVLTCATGNGGCDTSPMATCNEVVGGPNTCTCPGGYATSDGGVTCTDIDECASNNGGCDDLAACTNNAGAAATCGACPAGYVGTGATACTPTLTALSLSSGALSPALSAGVTNYDVQISLVTQTVTVTPTVPAGATVTINSQAVTSGQPWVSPVLNLGANTVTIVVSYAGHPSRTYTLAVTRGEQQVYLKASNTEANDNFAQSVAVSGDTIVVGAAKESSSAMGVNGNQGNNAANASGAAYVFVRSGSVWSQQAYLKASNTGVADAFGASVAISADTIVVGASSEASNATGVNGVQSNNSQPGAGAAYVFVRSGTVWSQQAYLKGSGLSSSDDQFGVSVAVVGDTIVVGATGKDVPSTNEGAAYVFFRTGTSWSPQGSLTWGSATSNAFFGNSVSVSGDTLAVGAYGHGSQSGAVVVFARNASVWSEQISLTGSNTEPGDMFGRSVSISGNTLVIGAVGEASNATGINGNEADNTAINSGAAYVFTRSGSTWSQQAYLKASNTEAGDNFGRSVGVSGDTVVVGALGEDSAATGVNGSQTDNSTSASGAAYVFSRAANIWAQIAYLKAGAVGASDVFGEAVGIDATTVVISAAWEDSSATGVDGNQADNGASNSGAAYVFR